MTPFAVIYILFILVAGKQREDILLFKRRQIRTLTASNRYVEHFYIPTSEFEEGQRIGIRVNHLASDFCDEPIASLMKSPTTSSIPPPGSMAPWTFYFDGKNLKDAVGNTAAMIKVDGKYHFVLRVAGKCVSDNATDDKKVVISIIEYSPHGVSNEAIAFIGALGVSIGVASCCMVRVDATKKRD